MKDAYTLTIAAGALVMNATNRVLRAHFDACADDAVHLLLHFRIATLHSPKV